MDFFGSFDVSTLFCLMFLTDMVVCFLLLGYGGNDEHTGEIRSFVAARSLHGTSCLALGFSGALGPLWGITVPTGAVFFAFAIEGITIRRFRRSDRSIPLVPLVLAAVGAALMFMVAETGAMAVGFASAIIALLFAYICAMLIMPSGRTRLVWMMSAIFSVNCTASLLRSYAGFFQSVSLDDRSGFQLFALLVAYVSSVAGGFGFLLLLKEKTDRKLQRDATTDSLTGLLNHRVFFESARTRIGDLPSLSFTAFISLDLDHFKRVNDTFGHPAGDDLLRQVGRLLAAEFDQNSLIGRVGGEEFAVLMPGDIDKAERLRQAMTGIRLADFPEYACTASLGVAIMEGGSGETLKSLVRRCDQALYEAKRGGRNRVMLAKASVPDVSTEHALPHAETKIGLPLASAA